MKLLHKSVFAKRITPMDEDFFFGYYDLQPFCGDLHLVHKLSFADRLHMRGDTAEVGLLRLDNGKYERLDVTGAWNFQQGAMLQWNPTARGDEIIYNSIGDGDFNATIMNIHTGKKRFLDRPVANVSPMGDYALSINFARMYNFRPGYGYAEFGDPFYYHNHSEKDGVFLTDLKTGKSRLILSMQEIWDFSHQFFGNADQKMVINHITFNTDGSRFLFLVRNFPKPGQRHDTAIITANRDGSGLYLLSDYGVQSHYHWKNEKEVIFYAGGRELDCARGWGNNYVMKDLTHEGIAVADYFFDGDNHMSYTPDRTQMITDTYPDARQMQTLRIYDFARNTCVDLGNFYSIPRSSTDLRCDLHPRWDETGSRISFDSTHEGYRGVYLMDIDAVREHLFDE